MHGDRKDKRKVAGLPINRTKNSFSRGQKQTSRRSLHFFPIYQGFFLTPGNHVWLNVRSLMKTSRSVPFFSHNLAILR